MPEDSSPFVATVRISESSNPSRPSGALRTVTTRPW